MYLLFKILEKSSPLRFDFDAHWAYKTNERRTTLWRGLTEEKGHGGVLNCMRPYTLFFGFLSSGVGPIEERN